MNPPLRQQLISALETGWAAYPDRYRRLSPAQQAVFLQQQGYVRFADLLAHFLAWWQDGLRRVEELQRDPQAPGKDYDVDLFNANAVAAAQGLSEDDLLRRFEAARQEWLHIIANLPESAFENPRLARRLEIELIGHLAEHPFA